jgi:hypothetical protein
VPADVALESVQARVYDQRGTLRASQAAKL